MGAENSILRSYDIGKPYKLNGRRSDNEGSLSQSSISSDDGPKQRKGMPSDDDAVKYSLCPAVHKEDGSNISVFVYQTAREAKLCLGSACAEVGLSSTEKTVNLAKPECSNETKL